ncbi:endopeptidase La [Candidatus Roizmanbacteria bacterium RIFCSPHIGHO2_01_FULL_39_12b]|uniref:Lon protease n=1 Tax=Candidatus Roizmanbacteria bacterium RIFCSPHIGHO2_01_FULL_39_12b TaxID=1802030 RepID=A0A1F7GBX7_9BACT|nr:MAG: endopeptidase La [Candidatus Roizmanbacteria bacterium RIFCSPHIGHO2_01_FULL_39_12b]OGK47059.1 MAG: endopeptidase La [Candidatus Roizmanbacteria bacterium RIFCSPLOWO2_01_FULL_39_19]
MDILKRVSDKSAYPLIPLRDGIIFPTTENALLFGREKSIQAMKAAQVRDNKIVLVMQKDSKIENPTARDFYPVGVVASINKIFDAERSEVTVLLHGISRVRIESYLQETPYFNVQVSELVELNNETDETNALVQHINRELKKAINLGKGVDVVFLMNIMNGATTAQFVEQVSMIVDVKPNERQLLVEELDLTNRLKLLSEYVSREVHVLELEKNIHMKTQKKFEKGMKDAVLREKLKTIEQELGGEVATEEDREIEDLRRKLKKAKMSDVAEEKAMKELERLARMSQYNPESSYIRTYLEWLADLPWNIEDKSEVDIKRAEDVLNKDHYGLKKVKERIIEHLAVLKLKKQNGYKEDHKKGSKEPRKIKQPTILCFVGPPGVGKTSLGRSISRALGREFVKLSLGGIRDEAEIRGHRRTYVGAMPGRIIQGIKQAKTRNPIFMLDEIDKIGHDYRGDPSSALLEALDPEQNFAFGDHYLEVSFDLSDVMFITTANMLDTIPNALRDRLEIINFAGYTEDEKFNIAKNYLLKKQLEVHGLEKKNINLTDDALKLIIQRYTREAGVRELERQVATIYRKLARQVVEKSLRSKNIKSSDIHKYLGAYKYSSQMIEEQNAIGISTGLAWTQAGGDILFIEVAVMPGKGNLTLTGQLGDVMKESCQAALSYIRPRYKELELEKNFYKDIDIHIHVPEGAVPKDGPSAGVAITTAMVSALSKVPVNREVGMTGEITLRGRVMEIGGVKEKVIAAHRAGIKTIILPFENKKDLEDIPQFIQKDLKFIFANNIQAVLKTALLNQASNRQKNIVN